EYSEETYADTQGEHAHMPQESNQGPSSCEAQTLSAPCIKSTKSYTSQPEQTFLTSPHRIYILNTIIICISENLISEGWQYFKGSLYLGSTTAGSWNESRKFCQEKGADLIIINSIQDFSLTQEFARKSYRTRWIGLSDLEQQGVWRWVDGSLLNTSFWYPGEPNNKGSTEHCVVVNYYNGRDNWNDYSCSEKCSYSYYKMHLTH
uniref:C-type lectin domain-containing protein n=1 Tax=Neogobius melanostomus TaxID=47308 RepID=A0A8C6SUX3_9GOBI